MASLTNNPLVNYVKESNEELRKVAWPNRKRVVRDTLIVIGISFAVAVFLGALDFGLSKGFEAVLEKVQSI
jgi:preprotein translocase subunit SecE